MSLRTRLIIAFLLLSVVPLTAVTLLSYRSSVQAFERAARREANERASDVSRRMDVVTAELGERVDRMFVATAGDAPDAMREGLPHPDPQKVHESLAPMLGDTAALLERVEFRPVPMTGRETGAPAAPGKPPGTNARGERPPVPRRPPGVIVVDVPKVLAEAKRAAQESTGELSPALAALVERSIALGMAGAEQGIAAAAEAIAVANVKGQAGAATKRVMLKPDGHRFEVAVRRDGRLLGTANATLNLERTLETVLAFSQREQGELPFAIDTKGKLYAARHGDLPRLRGLAVEQLAPRAAEGAPQRTGEWIVVAKRDASGIIFGIARPIGESLREIRRTSVRNLGLGFGVIALALIGIVPISHRMTQHLTSLKAGVQQLAGGDFGARVPVRSADEFGALAASFNQMAADLERHQSLVIEQERLRRELELSRQIQNEMLPHGPLRSGTAEIAGVSVPAREVGGDFFNYFDLPNGRLALLVGDVSGKGVGAALLMANAQATLRARLPLESDLAALADAFDRELDLNTPRSVYLTLFIATLDANGLLLRYVNAGHNPQFVIRRRSGIEPLGSTGLPIALYSGHGYREASVVLEPGDLLFFYTDGLVETENASGEMFGSERLEALLAEVQSDDIATILNHVEARVRAFRGDVEPFDDATMMALRVTASDPPA